MEIKVEFNPDLALRKSNILEKIFILEVTHFIKDKKIYTKEEYLVNKVL